MNDEKHHILGRITNDSVCASTLHERLPGCAYCSQNTSSDERHADRSDVMHERVRD